MLRSRWITALLICFCGAFLTTTLCGGKRDNEEDLKTHIQSEHNPVKKAKIQIRLAKLQLNQAEASYNQGQTEQGAALLGVYASTMQDAWEALRQSGRNGARQPQGFKELELALREGTRRLEDLKHRISYYDREPVDKVQQTLASEHNAVLKALFPTLESAPKPKSKHSQAPGATSWRPWP
ncbi:MAG: hypothetical protein LAP13_26395 [Acidobacteriia bacterium]|nr:hypothetical protein [Terriglobia bacterium]